MHGADLELMSKVVPLKAPIPASSATSGIASKGREMLRAVGYMCLCCRRQCVPVNWTNVIIKKMAAEDPTSPVADPCECDTRSVADRSV